jgi:hypothetical protein
MVPSATSKARIGRLEFTCVKAHIIPGPEEKPEDATDCTLEDEKVTQTEDWIDPEHLPPTSIPVFNVGLVAEEERDQQVDFLRRFSPYK